MSKTKQSQKEQQFNFKLWAILILLNGLQGVYVLVVSRRVGLDMSPWIIFQNVFGGILFVAAAVGFWLERKWGLWLYLISLVYFLISAAVAVIQGVLPPTQAIASVIFGILILGYLFGQRDQFN